MIGYNGQEITGIKLNDQNIRKVMVNGDIIFPANRYDNYTISAGSNVLNASAYVGAASPRLNFVVASFKEENGTKEYADFACSSDHPLYAGDTKTVITPQNITVGFTCNITTVGVHAIVIKCVQAVSRKEIELTINLTIRERAGAA